MYNKSAIEPHCSLGGNFFELKEVGAVMELDSNGSHTINGDKYQYNFA